MYYEIGYLIAAMMGGVVILYLMTRLVLLVFRDKKHSTVSISISAFVSLGIATILAGYGMSEGDSPDFVNSFVNYLIPAIIVIVIEIFRVRRIKAKSISTD